MKKIAVLLLTLLLLSSAALAQEYVSISDLYDQAQAMGGVWKETFETKNGTVTVDVPIIVPEVSQLPVLTVKRAKISKDAYDFLTQGQKTTRRKNAFEYSTAISSLATLIRRNRAMMRFSIFGFAAAVTDTDRTIGKPEMQSPLRIITRGSLSPMKPIFGTGSRRLMM